MPFKECIKDAYLETSQTSIMERFCENNWRLNSADYFRKKAWS